MRGRGEVGEEEREGGKRGKVEERERGREGEDKRGRGVEREREGERERGEDDLRRSALLPNTAYITT